MLIRTIATLCIVTFSIPVVAQEAAQRAFAAPAVALQAAAVTRGRYPMLSQLVRAKMAGTPEKRQLILMLPSYRMEKQEGEFTVTKFRQEQRTRTMTRDGKQVEVPYTVSVPYSERVTDPMVPVAAGDKPNTFDVDQFVFYDLEANVLDAELVAERMTKLGPAFLLERFPRNFTAIPPLQREALNPNCVVIATAEVVRKPPPRSQIRPVRK